MTIIFPNTKLLVAGTGFREADLATLSSAIESAPSLGICMGSLVVSHDIEPCDKIARASKVFGALRNSVFQNSSLSRQTKKMVYQAVVLGVLLYAGET